MAEEKKKCTACAEEINAGAVKCKFCGETQTGNNGILPFASGANPELFNPKTASSLSLFLTPAFGAFLIYKNWLALEKQTEARKSRVWLLATIVLTALFSILLDIETLAGAQVIMLVAWYYLQGRPQQKYIQKNCPDYQSKSLGKPVLKTIGILAVWWGILIILLSMFGSPNLDCSSNQAFAESGAEIIEYLKDDVDIEELAEKEEHGDLSDEEQELIIKLNKLVLFFKTKGPNSLPDKVLEQIDGMAAYEILEYVDQRMDYNGYWRNK